MSVRLDHVGVVVPDLDAAVAFFTEALGFAPARAATLGAPEDRLPETFGSPPGASVRVAFFEAPGGGTVELLEWRDAEAQTDARAPQDAGTAHLALAVGDVAAVAARLGAVPGVTVFEAHRLGFVYVRAPWGLLIQLVAS